MTISMNKLNLFALIVISIFIPTIIASEFPVHYDDYVNDFAGIFNGNEISSLRSLLSEVRQNTTAEIVLVTMTNLSGYTPQEYATKLFTDWKIGKADKDNGLLILYAVNEKKIWVTTGYGLEGILPDSKIGRMLDDYYVPLRDEGKINEGIISITTELTKVVEENKAEVISGQGANSGNNTLIAIVIIVIVLFIFMFIISRFQKKKDKKTKKKNLGPYLNALFFILLVIYFISGAFLFLIIAIILMIILRIIGRNPSSPWFIPMGSGFSSGGGFGGGGFGGGMSGGGGAGR